jgi:hypothetical protein
VMRRELVADLGHARGVELDAHEARAVFGPRGSLGREGY